MTYDDYNDAINNITGNELYQKTYNRLKSKYGDRVIFIRHLSSDAVNLIPDNIDFLYIDGNHCFKYVYNDLKLYYPKVKSNCYIMGDDAFDLYDHDRNKDGDVYLEWSPGSYGHYGVIKAFREFISEKNINGTIIVNQYVIQKP